MSMSPKFQRKKQNQATSDFAHHTRRRERFREEEARNVEARFGDRETFGRRQDVKTKRGFLARLRPRHASQSSVLPTDHRHPHL